MYFGTFQEYRIDLIIQKHVYLKEKTSLIYGTKFIQV